jgi:undecaprenyl diphosphate synthase
MRRSSEEVGLLFKLFLSVLRTETKKLKENNIRLKIVGDLTAFTPEIITLAKEAESSLQKNTGLTLVIAANYGGQWDIAETAKKIAIDVSNGDIDPENIDTSLFNRYTSLSGLPEVDLLIRTSGEIRLSNFLLWDIAYSEFYFCKTLWPDFNEDSLDEAIDNFHKRDRRFGERNGEH